MRRGLRTDNGRRVERGQRKERGTVTLLGIGLATLLLFVGGFSVDLWRAHSERRALAELADAAAAAGANGIDTDRYRATGELALDPALAEALAWESIVGQPDQRALVGFPTVAASAEVVVVQVEGEVEMTLLRLFSGGEPFSIEVTAEAVPARGLN